MKINLIVQYYKCDREDRQKEIDTCLRENLQNPHIAAAHLLTEEELDVSAFPKPDKIRQTVIGERLTYERAFKYANDWPEPAIWILANADIYFDDTLRFLPDVDFTNQIFALTRHNVMSDGSLEFMPPEYAHGSQDAWIFTTPVPVDRMFTGFYLGIPSCDQKIAYEFIQAEYIVSNPSRRIIARHLDLASGLNIDERTMQYMSITNAEGYKAGLAASPPHQVFLYPSEKLCISSYDLFTMNLQLFEEISILNKNVELSRQEISDMQLTIQNLNNTIADCDSAIADRDITIEAYKNSISWKITYPLRWLANILLRR